ncbi:GntR family transcriptional regulator [Paenibacillus nasutitermitis]|uniref:GntR family transcriptional regulator n=2 Tax=Paenibacillus nasutitermitis TaxID=1652958 RepID=A0A916ZB81_9BACL|nr:GntR family transcriptional regulator [Paenibacillus nasutitermitis]
MPLYLTIQEYFKQKIISKELLPNDRIPTEKELMKQFNVSRITVAKALSLLAEEGWIHRIPGRGSFVAETVPVLHDDVPGQHDPVSPLESVRNQSLIGLIIPHIDSFFAIRLLRGIEQVLKKNGYSFVIMVTYNSREEEQKAIRELISKGVAGLLIFTGDQEIYNDELLTLKVKRFPFVLVDRYLPGVETHYIGSDNKSSAREAVSYLWELGHRDIAICSNTQLPTVTVNDRIDGYMEELKNRGVMINPALMLTDIEVDAAEEINQDHPLYRYIKARSATAYLAMHAMLGVHITRIAKHIGLRIPEDISIVTYDNPFPRFGDDLDSFTHIAQSEQQIGTEAARVLIELLQKGDRAQGYRKIIVPPKLVPGKSTGSLELHQQGIDR